MGRDGTCRAGTHGNGMKRERERECVESESRVAKSRGKANKTKRKFRGNGRMFQSACAFKSCCVLFIKSLFDVFLDNGLGNKHN